MAAKNPHNNNQVIKITPYIFSPFFICVHSRELIFFISEKSRIYTMTVFGDLIKETLVGYFFIKIYFYQGLSLDGALAIFSWLITSLLSISKSLL